MSEHDPRLDYERKPEGNPPTVPVWGQAILGMFSAFAAVALIVLLLRSLNFSANSAFPPALQILTPLGGLAAGSIVASKMGWKSFLPGVLLGLTLCCLVPIGIVLVICGSAKY